MRIREWRIMSDGVSDIACGASPGPAESPGRLRAQSLWSGLGFGDVKVRKCKSHLGRRMMVSDRQAHTLSPPGLSARRVTTYVESTAPAVLARPETTLKVFGRYLRIPAMVSEAVSFRV